MMIQPSPYPDRVYDRAMVINLDQRAKPFIQLLLEETVSATVKHRQRLPARPMNSQAGISERIKALDKYLMTHFGSPSVIAS